MYTFNRVSFFFVILFLLSFNANSQDLSFNPQKDIINHIQDSHKWNIIGDINIYLPVILFYKNKVHMFSSKEFYKNPFLHKKVDNIYI
ncbi:MAG: hypothetical protein IR527_00425 [Bacteroides sp.]|nr:MAG: hypothetical protein IR527_00425 [Bacteroides sp.]